MTHPSLQGAQGAITDVAGIEVGHYTETRRHTGCSVVIARDGAVGGVDVRGAAPGTRETELLHPSNFVERVHAVMLSGGSAWGLDAASGAARWLEEQGVGFDIGVGRLPLVPAAVLFDLHVGDARVRPDAAAGYAACAAASRQAPEEGNVGAGTGAALGKIFGIQRAMKGGIGTASVTVDGVTVGALIACNALGDVYHPTTGELLAGAVVTEAVFGLNGLGTLTQQAVGNQDTAVLQAVVVVSAAAFVLINLAVDLLYPLLDPRLRHSVENRA